MLASLVTLHGFMMFFVIATLEEIYFYILFSRDLDLMSTQRLRLCGLEYSVVLRLFV